jgi:putative flippase GtrA
MSSPSRARRALALGARFLTVGAISTIIEIVSFNALLAFGVEPVTAKIVASLIALVNAYFGNRHWAFRSRARRSRRAEIALFLVTNAVCTALGAVIVWGGDLAVEAVFGREAGVLALNAVNLFSIAVVVVVRFALYHFIVFRAQPTRH